MAFIFLLLKCLNLLTVYFRHYRPFPFSLVYPFSINFACNYRHHRRARLALTSRPRASFLALTPSFSFTSLCILDEPPPVFSRHRFPVSSDTFCLFLCICLTSYSFLMYLSHLQKQCCQRFARVRSDRSCSNDGIFNKSLRESELGRASASSSLICSPSFEGEKKWTVCLSVCLCGEPRWKLKKPHEDSLGEGNCNFKEKENLHLISGALPPHSPFRCTNVPQIKTAGVCRVQRSAEMFPSYPWWLHLPPWIWMLPSCWAGLRDSHILKHACGTS